MATTNITERGTNIYGSIRRIAILPGLGCWVKTTVHFILSSQHSPLHHSNSWEFSYPCCPSQGIFPPSAIQTLVSLSGNNWSLGWSCYPAFLCYLLDVRGSQTLESLPILTSRNRRNRLCVMYSFHVDTDDHRRGSTSRHVVGTEIQRDCNFEGHTHHFSYLLGRISSLWPILSSWLSNYF